jgi:hypothetical protein
LAWKKICAPHEEGDLGLRSLIALNDAANLKLCWDLMHSKEDWATILISRVLRNGIPIPHHIFSSIWSSIKQEALVILENSSWKVGTGHIIKLWTDCWCGAPIAQSLNIHHNVCIWLPSKVSDIIHNQQWNIPIYLDILVPNLKLLVNQVTLPV